MHRLHLSRTVTLVGVLFFSCPLIAADPQPPVKYTEPKGTVVPRYRYVGKDAVGKIPFYMEYSSQEDNRHLYRGNKEAWFENLETITEYSTLFPIRLFQADDPEIFEWIIELTQAAYKKKQLIVFFGYDYKGVDRLGRVLDRLEKLPEGQDIIRNIIANHLADEPYLGGQTAEQVEELIAYFDDKIKSRYPHIQSWINFAVSTEQLKTWGTGKEGDGRRRLPKGLDIVGIDWYAFLGNGTRNNWGHKDFRVAEKQILDTVFPKYMDDQTKRMKEAIAACYPPGKEPMMWFVGCSSYPFGIAHPTPPSVQDAYFEYIKNSEWAGLCWWIFEDFKEGGEHGNTFLGGRNYEVIRCHQRHGQRIRDERLY